MSETPRADRCRENRCGHYAGPGCMRMLCACPNADDDMPDVSRWSAALVHSGAFCPAGEWAGLPADRYRPGMRPVGRAKIPVAVLVV